MRSNSPLLAAACCSLHVRTYNVCQVSVCWHARSAALRLHGAFSPVSTTILLRWGWASLCFLAACLRSAVAGLQRSQRDSTQQQRCLCRPGRPGQTHLFAECRSSDSERSLFAFWARPSRYVRAKKKKTRAPRIHLHFFVFASSLFPFFFVTRSKKMILEIVLASVR